MVGIHTVTWCVEQSLVSVKNTASGARFSGLHDLGQAPYPLCDSTSSSVKWARLTELLQLIRTDRRVSAQWRWTVVAVIISPRTPGCGHDVRKACAQTLWEALSEFLKFSFLDAKYR